MTNDKNDMPDEIYCIEGFCDVGEGAWCIKPLGEDVKYIRKDKLKTALALQAKIDSGDMRDIAREQYKLWEQYLGGHGDYYPNNEKAWLGCLIKAMLKSAPQVEAQDK